MNTPAETTTNAASGPEQLVEDVHPLVERISVIPDAARPLLEKARPWADPIVDEMRPIINDLRPVVQELREEIADRLARMATAATQLAARIDLDSVARLGRLARAGGQHLMSLHPMPRAGRFGVSGPRATPRVFTAPRMPSVPIVAAVRSIARRLRPGRWAFRTVAIAGISLLLSNASLRDAMVAEINWSRSVVQTMEMPTIVLPTIEVPTIELPTIQLPSFEIPTFRLPQADSAATSKLVPARFELPPLTAYRAAFETQASYPTVPPNATVEWVVALRNTGSVGWYRGIDGAQAALALADGTEVAVQSTEYVAPGQVGWFIAHFRAPAAAGTHSVALFPRIDGRGPLPDLGILAHVTVR